MDIANTLKNYPLGEDAELTLELTLEGTSVLPNNPDGTAPQATIEMKGPNYGEVLLGIYAIEESLQESNNDIMVRFTMDRLDEFGIAPEAFKELPKDEVREVLSSADHGYSDYEIVFGLAHDDGTESDVVFTVSATSPLAAHIALQQISAEQQMNLILQRMVMDCADTLADSVTF